MFIDLCRKEAKITKVNIEYLEKYIQEEEVKEYKDIEGKMKQLDSLLDKVYWYDAKVFRLPTEEKMSIAELSKKTGISYYSLYNTYKNVKSLIKTEMTMGLGDLIEKITTYTGIMDSKKDMGR